MPLHPSAEALIAQMAAAARPPITELAVDEVRQGYVAGAVLAGPRRPVHRVEELVIPSQTAAIGARLYAPESAVPLPALVYYHGGGWVIGDLETHDATCRQLSLLTGCVVVAVDYRLAPDHKFPTAAEDAYAAFAWVVQNAAALGIDPARVAVGGDSAGGNLSAVVALMARDRGGARPVFQLLVYPVTDFSFETASYAENADGYILTRHTMRWFWNHYLAAPEDGANPYASPLRAPDLRGLPPALVITAEFDPLRDEGEAYGERLRGSGVPVTTSRYPGMTHGFFHYAGALPPGDLAMREAAAALRGVFGLYGL